MTSSSAVKRFERHRPTIASAVDRGLSKNGIHHLDRLFNTESDTTTDFSDLTPSWMDPGPDDGRHEVRVCGGTRRVETRHHFTIRYVDVAQPPLEPLERWASKAVTVFHDEVITQIVHATRGATVHASDDAIWETIPTDNGFHHLRLLDFGSCPKVEPQKSRQRRDLTDGLHFVETIKLTSRPRGVPHDVVGLLYEQCGGPALFRRSGPTLSHSIHDDGSVELELVQQLRIGTGDGAARRIALDTSRGTTAHRGCPPG